MAGYTGRAQGMAMLQQGFGQLQNAFVQGQRMRQEREQFDLEKKHLELEAKDREQRMKSLDEGMSGLEKAFGMQVGGAAEAPPSQASPTAEMPGDAPLADAMPQFLQPPQQIQQAPAAGMDAQGIPSFLTPQGPQTIQPQAPPAPDNYTEQDRRAALLQAGLQLARGGNEALGNSIVSDLLAADGGTDPLKLSQIEKTQLETEQIRYKMLMDMQKNEMAKQELASNQQFFGSRNEFAELFAARAQEAKSPEDKLRLRGYSVALRAAEDGKQMASILEQAMPGQFEGGKMTAFDGILKQSGGDAIRAFTTMEQIKANARTQYEKAGGMLDEVATAYLGNRFYKLGPEEQQQAIQIAKQKEEEAKSLAEAEAKKLEPLTGQALTDVNKMDDMLERLNTVMDFLKPEFVGRLTQYGLSYKDKAGTDPELSKFIGAWENFENYVLRPDSGAVIGLTEEGAVKRQVGSLGHEYEALVPRLLAFKDYITTRRNRIITNSITPAAQLQEKMDTERAQRSQQRREQGAKPPAPPAAPAEPAKPGASTGVVRDPARGEANINKLLPGLLGSPSAAPPQGTSTERPSSAIINRFQFLGAPQ